MHQNYRYHKAAVISGFLAVVTFLIACAFISGKMGMQSEAHAAEKLRTIATNNQPEAGETPTQTPETTQAPEPTATPEPTPTPEPPRAPEIQLGSGRNEQGYYHQSPEIQMKNLDERFGLGYELLLYTDGTWKLKKKGEEKETLEVLLKDATDADGRWKVQCWLTDGENKLDETKKSQEFLVDTTPPKAPKFTSSLEETDGNYIGNGKTKVVIKGEDSFSGIASITYWLEDEKRQEKKGEEAVVTLEAGYEGAVYAQAKDLAGNVGKKGKIGTFILDNTAPIISLKAPRPEAFWYDAPVDVMLTVEEKGTTAGIRSVEYSIDQQDVQYSQKMSQVIHVQKESTLGKPVQVTAKAIDQAGNESETSINLYIDLQNPKLKFSGTKAYEITKDPVLLSISASDENQLASGTVRIIWIDEHKKKTINDYSLPLGNDGVSGLEQKCMKDGRYHVTMEAVDLAGHKSARYVTFTIDKKFPMIDQIEKLDQTYLQSFVWQEETKKIVTDYTNYTCQLLFDGNIYHRGERIYEEGVHQFQIKAKDAAGNESRKQVRFVIDHTNPTIRITGIEAGKKYKKPVTLHVESEEDSQIKSVRINQKEEAISGDSKRIYEKVIRKAKTYELEVTAIDLAGNIGIQKMKFKMEQPSTPGKEILKPVKQYLSQYVGAGQKDENKIQHKNGKRFRVRKGKIMTYGVLCAVTIGGILSAGFLWGKKKRAKRL